MNGPLPIPQPSTIGLFRLSCPKCGLALTFSGKDLPQLMQCNACGESFAIPSAETLQDVATIDANPARDVSAAAVNDLSLPGFEILEVLGEGGMGIVYKARDPELRRLVAVKMIRSKRIADPEERERMVQRFRREAEAVARLQHPHVVQIFSIGETEQGPYFAMEHIDGGTLGSMVRGTPQNPNLAANLLRTLALAMHEAHLRQIVHRDLKPGNVLLHFPPGVARTLEHAIPKIADFGLAKDVEPLEDQGQTMGIVGTPSYMAPEQASAGGTVGPTADVYALGAILYDLLTGRPPFKGASVLDTLELVRTQDPVPPSRLQPRLPRDLEVICLKCLCKEPHRRYASAQLLADDLERFLDGRPIFARPAGTMERAWKWTRRNPARAGIAALSVLSIVALFAAILWDRDRTKKHADELSQQNRKTEEANKLAVRNEGIAKEEAAEKDRQRKQALEKTIRLTVGEGLKLQQDGNGLAALLHFAEAAGLEDPRSPTAWLHDVRIAACLDQYPRVAQTWAHRQAVTRVVFSPDGKQVLSSSADGTVQVRDTATGKPSFPNPLSHPAAVNDACFSLDGKSILTGCDDKTTRLWNAASGEPLGKPLKHAYPVMQVGFDPTGSGKILAVVGNRNSMATQRDQPRIMVPQRIPTGVGPNGVPMFTTIMVPGPSTGPIRREAIGRVELWDDLSSEKPSRTMLALGWVNHAAFSRDGQSVVTANASLEKPNSIALWPVRGSEKPPFIKLKGLVQHAAISSDGLRIAAAAGNAEKGIGEARIFDSATQAPLGVVMKHRGPVAMLQFSPDGKSIATASHDGTARIWDALGEPITEPMRHGDRVIGVWYSDDGQRVLTASSDGSACVWNSSNGEALTPFLLHASAVTHASFHPTAPLVAVGCADGVVRIWNTSPRAFDQPIFKTKDVLPPTTNMAYEIQFRTHVRKVTLLPGAIATGVRFDRTGTHLLVPAGQRFQDVTPGNQSESLSGFKTTHVTLWDAKSGRLVAAPWKHTGPFDATWAASDGSFALINEAPGSPRSLELRLGDNGSLIAQQPLEINENVRALRMLPKGEAVVLLETTSPKAKPAFRIQRLGSGPKEPSLPCAVVGELEDACISEDGAHVALLTLTTAGKAIHTTASIRKISEPVDGASSSWRIVGSANRIKLNADGRIALAYASARSSGPSAHDGLGFTPESEVQILNAGSSDAATVKHRRPITYADFSGDGTFVVTCSQDRTARVWHASGKPATPPLEHRDAVHHAAVSQSGLVATAAGDGGRVWDLATGEPLTPPLRHTGGAIEIAFRADDRMAATAGLDGSVRLWAISRTHHDVTTWMRIAERLSSHRLSTQGRVALDVASIVKLADAALNEP